MRIDPCKECGEYVNIPSDHAPDCSLRQGFRQS
ncbi:hypothetical protein SEA_EMOTION_57 [Arthrobacter phage Emotion]|uniref:Uncharacterized protein n=1 Tax=Arthrobacter phage Emotion TaxID=3038361 RepID=A0AA49ERQ7_9CAUD|nr:hypothetical protein SEA_EMOTION_57 [Arthrobacter phage Emotion]